MQQERRYFVPQQVSGNWMLYGLSGRHLWRLSGLLVVLPIACLITYLLWRWAVPGPGMLRMILRSTYVLIFPVSMSAAWVGLMVMPVADAGRTWWDVMQLAQTHRSRQTLFLPRRHITPPTETPAATLLQTLPVMTALASEVSQSALRPRAEDTPTTADRMINPFVEGRSEAATTREGVLNPLPLAQAVIWISLVITFAVLLWLLHGALTGDQSVARLFTAMIRWLKGS